MTLSNIAIRKRKQVESQTGISIGRDGIAIARVEWRGEEARPYLTLCEFHPLSDGQDPGPLLRELATRCRFGEQPCISLLGDDDFSLLLVEAPQVEAAEMRDAVRWRIKDLVDFRLDDAVLEVFDVGGQATVPPAHRMVYVVAAQAASVRRHIDLVEGAGAQLDVVEIHPLAQNNIAALLPGTDHGVALLHFGRHGGLFTQSYGGDLVLARNLKFGTAEMAASYIGRPPQSPEGTVGVQEANHLFDSVAQELRRSLDYYALHFHLPAVAELVLAPLDPPVEGLSEHIADALGLPVRSIDLSLVLASDVEFGDGLQATCLPAIGAALRPRARAS